MSWKLELTCCHSNSDERPSAKADVKNSQGVINDNNKKYNQNAMLEILILIHGNRFLKNIIKIRLSLTKNKAPLL